MSNINSQVGQWNRTNNTYGLKKPLFNYLDNGDFEVNQRKPGTALALSASTFGYFIDRWMLIQGTGVGTFTGSHNNLINSLGQIITPADPDIDATVSLAISAGTVGNTSRIEQWIPNVKQFASRWLTASVYLFSTAAFTPKIEILQYFGSGGSPSASVSYALTGNVLVASTWTLLTLSALMASVSGKTLGSDNLHGTIVRIYPSSVGGITGTMLATLAQLEEGSNYTGFHKKPLGDEELNCRRYYQKSFPPATLAAQNSGQVGREMWSLQSNGANDFYLIKFPVVMQKTPSMVYLNPAGANALAHNYRANNDGASTATNAGSRHATEVVVGPGAGWAANDLISLNWEAKGDISDPA